MQGGQVRSVKGEKETANLKVDPGGVEPTTFGSGFPVANGCDMVHLTWKMEYFVAYRCACFTTAYYVFSLAVYYSHAFFYYMASLYMRGQTYWLTYKDDSGKWRSKSTGYRANNFGEKKQAELLCRKATKEEQAARDVSVAGDQFEDWVPRWLKERYEGRKGTTYDRYSRSWRVLE